MAFDLWLVFIPAVFLLNMAPGPNNLLVMNNAARFGLGTATVAGMGRMPAFAFLVGLTAVGLGAVLAASEMAFTVIKWVGAVYLVYLGIKLWRAPVEDTVLAERSREAVNIRALATQEFLSAIANPKAILVFTAFFPQFMDASQPPTGQLLIMGATFLVLEAVALVLYGLGGAGMGRFFATARGRRIMNRVSGGALVMAGAALAAARK
ncbi:LysE family translocator [Novispirillum itersonii]|uniref:LysE family translocator n=1 Tax=Novispirillum itersonii TaxID=189 RepID=UPI00037C351E|nr:LysE family translocator [Novispirillum itersonii]